MRQTLSVAIITYNEEEHIRDCILSCIKIADEIVVVDSFSTDATPEICQEFDKVRFLQQSFTGYKDQKNNALQACTSDWIFSLDADERLTPELALSIQDFLATPQKANGAKSARLTNHMQRFIRHGGWYPNTQTRLVRKNTGAWQGGSVHEKLVIQGKTVLLAGNILHYSFKDIADQVETINRYSSLAALDRFHRNKTASLLRLAGKPLSKFLETYFLKRGFLDGIPGFCIAINSAFARFLREAKIYELCRLGHNKPSNLPPPNSSGQ